MELYGEIYKHEIEGKECFVMKHGNAWYHIGGEIELNKLPRKTSKFLDFYKSDKNWFELVSQWDKEKLESEWKQQPTGGKQAGE